MPQTNSYYIDLLKIKIKLQPFLTLQMLKFHLSTIKVGKAQFHKKNLHFENKRFQQLLKLFMSNIRDLQRLRGVKPIQQLNPAPSRLNPNFNYDPLSIPIPNLKLSKNTFYGKQSIRPTPSKMIHKRGSSFGTPQINERHTFNLIQNPRLSIYNFPLKLQGANFSKQHFHPVVEGPKTDRKIKNNYVSSQQPHPEKRDNFLQKRQTFVSHHHQINKNSFNLLMAVGKGGFGKVWKVEQKGIRRIYAMKLMSKAKVINKKSVSSVLNQRNFLAKLNHPFIVNMNFAFQDRQYLYLIMDYLDGGDLRYHLGNRQFFSEKQTKFFIANILLSLQYLHRHKIIHRDLKPENLVFDSHGFLRLTDLGISRQLREDNHQDTSGTPGYMAPEVMLRKSHSYMVDYFALGVIAYQLMLGKRPYQGANRKEIKEQILAKQVSVRVDQLPYRWSPFVIDFINRLLTRNPEQRLGANGIEQIKEHPWLSDVEWQKILSKKAKAPFKPMSIEEDYENYKQQISEDTINNNQQQVAMLLRRHETQQLFEGYEFARTAFSISKKTSYPTNNTEQNFGRK